MFTSTLDTVPGPDDTQDTPEFRRLLELEQVVRTLKSIGRSPARTGIG
jgi:hypothetical protein